MCNIVLKTQWIFFTKESGLCRIAADIYYSIHLENKFLFLTHLLYLQNLCITNIYTQVKKKVNYKTAFIPYKKKEKQLT